MRRRASGPDFRHSAPLDPRDVTETPSSPTLAAAGPALARTDPAQFDATQLAALEQLQTWLRGVVTLQGSFTQEAPDGTTSTGRFYIQKPGHLRFEYAPPARLQIVADGFWVAIQDKKLKTTEKYPLATTPLKLILDDKVDLLADADITQIYPGAELTTVTLQESAGGATGELSLMFDPHSVTLQRWVIVDAQGMSTTVELDQTVANAAIDPAMFNIIENRILDVGGTKGK